MLEPISIGTSTMPNQLFNKLNGDLQILKKEGIPLSIDIDQIGDITFLDCWLQGQQTETFMIIKNYIANCLAEVIVEEWEQRIIKKLVRHNYFYYSDEEKMVILQKAKEILNPVTQNRYHIQERKEKVLLKVLDYLDLHKELVLEGFINFRLKDYHQDLEDIVNSAVDEFLLEKEYQEFIRLLKYFVDIQDPRVDKVKIYFDRQGKFKLVDQADKPVQHEATEGIMLDLQEADLNYDDLLISALITLAPREIELHLEKGVVRGDTIKTIEHVFGSRIHCCTGCKFCEKL